jgi:recombination protein RecR
LSSRPEASQSYREAAAERPAFQTDRPELILATSPTVEGEATARYLADETHRQQPTLRITRIATGVPAGSDIEYADEVTMTRSLENRRSI